MKKRHKIEEQPSPHHYKSWLAHRRYFYLKSPFVGRLRFGDSFGLIRPPLEWAEERIREKKPDFDLNKIPLNDPSVLSAMVSTRVSRAKRVDEIYAPLSGYPRKILMLAKIKTPTFEELMMVKTLPRADQGITLVNEFVARRSGSKVVYAAAMEQNLGHIIEFPLPRPMNRSMSSSCRKWGDSYTFVYPPPKPLHTILAETYGLIFYRDQVQTIYEKVAGRSLTEKQLSDFWKTLRPHQEHYLLARFMAGGTAKGYSAWELSEILWYMWKYGGAAGAQSRSLTREILRIYYLHAYLWVYFPIIYKAAWRKRHALRRQ